MTKILIGLTLLISLSSFAESEFERGYNQGKMNCTSNGYISCQVSGPHHLTGDMTTAIGEGTSRGEAISSLIQHGCLQSSMSTSNCLKLVRQGDASCSKL